MHFTGNLLNMWLELCIFILASTRVSSFVNVAHDTAQKLQGTATMSEDPQTLEWAADKAVDGNTDQSIPNCAMMDFSKNYKSVWWKVRLGNRYNIAYLEVYFRKSTINRATGYYFYSYDSSEIFDGSLPNPKNLIYHHDPMKGCPSSITNITVNRLGQEIVFLNKRISGFVTECDIDDPAHVGVEICEVKVMGCDVNRYSSNKCGEECDMKCKSKNCDVFNGSCIYGCSNSNALTIDCIVCRDGEYIVNGKCEPCGGHCKLGTSCNKTTGKCDGGCKDNWTGDYCNSCPYPYYGSECNTPCGQCSGNDKCDNVTGDCPHGCRLHWQEPKCDVCKDGFYKEDCSSKCGHCKDNYACSKDDGYCIDGCRINFQEPLCQECKPRFYNSSNYCTTSCGQCKDNVACDKETGQCPSECKLYFQKPLCQECTVKYYGDACNMTCDYCIETAPDCRRNDGSCLYGRKVAVMEPIEEEKDKDVGLYIVIGILAVILATAVGIIIYQRRQITTFFHKSNQSQSQAHPQTNQTNYDNLTELVERHQYTTLDAKNEDSPYQEMP